jgi:drug/metabolite transporter (DMT)-like permease
MTDRRTAGAFAGCAVLAGGNAVCVRLSNRELTPLWGAGLRFALAAVLLWGLVRLWRVPLPQGRALMGSVAYGLLNFAAAFALAYVGLVRASAGSAAALLALVPLATLTLAVVHGQEHVRGPAVIGGVLAVLGVGVVSKASLDQAVPALSVLALLGAVVCMAEATVMARRFPDVHPIAANAIGMTAAAAVLIAGSAAVEGADSLVLPQLGATWFALLYLVPAGSVGVFVLFLVVVTHMEASRAAYVDVLIPIITGALAAWILDEPLGAELALGGVLILVGVYLGALHLASPKGGQVSAAVGESDELESTGAGGM